MIVTSIEWIDKSIKEAEVTVSDGKFSVICFSHPFNKTVNSTLSEPIYCLDIEGLMITDNEIFSANRTDVYGYSICGKLIDKDNKIVLLGDIRLCLDNAHIPGDILSGSFVEFSVSRLSIY